MRLSQKNDPRVYVEFEFADVDSLRVDPTSYVYVMPPKMKARLVELLTKNETVRISGQLYADVRPFYEGVSVAVKLLAAEFKVEWEERPLPMRGVAPGTVF